MADYVARGGHEGYDRLLVLAKVHRAGTLALLDRAAARVAEGLTEQAEVEAAYESLSRHVSSPRPSMPGQP